MRNIVAAIIVIAITSQAQAMQVIEGQGKSYPIIEKSKSKEISKKYLEASKKKLSNEQLEKKRVVQLSNPPKPATQDKTRMVDITYTLPFDIKDENGNIIKKKGYQYNPLLKIQMTGIIVIDGEKKQHIEWAKEQKEKIKNAKIIISKGSYIKVSREYKLRVYHLKDAMVERLQIQKVPCIIIQEGQMLKIKEFKGDRL